MHDKIPCILQRLFLFDIIQSVYLDNFVSERNPFLQTNAFDVINTLETNMLNEVFSFG